MRGLGAAYPQPQVLCEVSLPRFRRQKNRNPQTPKASQTTALHSPSADSGDSAEFAAPRNSRRERPKAVETGPETADSSTPGNIAANTHSTHRTANGTVSHPDDSCAWRASSLRPSPSQTMPVNRTKQTSAMPPTRDSPPTAASIAVRTNPSSSNPPRRSPMYISHSLTNPFSGGMAANASAPISIAMPVRGIRFINPPSRSMSLVPAPCSTLPAQRNISPFIREWFHMCKNPPANPIAATSKCPRVRPQSPMPSANNIRPTFSMLE